MRVNRQIPEQSTSVTRRFGAAALTLGLSATALAACSDSTGDDPLPLSDSDSGVIVDDAPTEEPLVEDDPLDDAPVEGEDQMEEDGG